METTFDKTKTALVVIDLQKGIAAMPTEPHTAATVIANASLLAEACRQNQIPVFLVCVSFSPDAKDRLIPIADVPMMANQAVDPSWSEIVPEMHQAETDFIITKRQWGAFYGTELDLQLRRRGIETILLCGISTNIGVESTARTAYELGYNQIFVEDAMAARSSVEHEHALKTVFPRMGCVRSLQEVLHVISTEG